MKRFVRSTRRWVSIGVALVGCLSIVCGAIVCPPSNPRGDDVLRAAYDFTNGGGYSLEESGAPRAVAFQGVPILKASRNGSNCSGFTFTVAMSVIQQRALLANASLLQIKRFQKDWYGCTGGTGVKTLVVAMERLGVGREIYPLDAQPGDFVQFWCGKSGHSVIFLSWVKVDGKIIGLKYRSSQPATKGVGDREQYFTTSGYSTATILPEKFFVGRLNP